LIADDSLSLVGRFNTFQVGIPPGQGHDPGERARIATTRPVKGILSMALRAVAEGRGGLIVPRANAAEAAIVEGLDVYPVGSLAEAVGFPSGQLEMGHEPVD
jgi:magnesium chelatase family protein